MSTDNPMTIAPYDSICLACIRSRGADPAKVGFACPEDGQAIVDHALARQCPIGNYSKPKPVTWAVKAARIARGAVGAAKAMIGVDRATEAIVGQRQAACAACKHNDGRGGCRECGCVISLKILVAGEECPEKRWGKERKSKPPPKAGCDGCGK